MKHLFLGLMITFTLSAMADIDEKSAINVEPKPERIEAARACFSELEKLGCGHPKQDMERFRSCMSQVHETLDSGCQKIMQRLYGK